MLICLVRVTLGYNLVSNQTFPFDPLNNILGPYKQTVSQKNKRSLKTKEKAQDEFYLTKILKKI